MRGGARGGGESGRAVAEWTRQHPPRGPLRQGVDVDLCRWVPTRVPPSVTEDPRADEVFETVAGRPCRQSPPGDRGWSSFRSGPVVAEWHTGTRQESRRGPAGEATSFSACSKGRVRHRRSEWTPGFCRRRVSSSPLRLLRGEGRGGEGPRVRVPGRGPLGGEGYARKRRKDGEEGFLTMSKKSGVVAGGGP